MWLSPWWWLFGLPYGFWFAPAPALQAPAIDPGTLVTYAVVTLGMALLTRTALQR